MQLVDGKRIAQNILESTKQRVLGRKIKPTLAVVLVGNNPASLTYVQRKHQAADYVGIKFILNKFPETISTDGLIKQINAIQKKLITGIIVQLPLPKHIDQQKVLLSIKPELDVDCLSEVSLGRLARGSAGLMPPTVSAIFEILKQYKVSLKNKIVAVVGQGELVGKPLVSVLMQYPITLIVCGLGTKNLSEYTSQADIVISGVGKADLITAKHIKKGAVLIDAGASLKNKKIVGDVKLEDVKKKAKLVTATPGGVGPITVAKLLENVVLNF